MTSSNSNWKFGTGCCLFIFGIIWSTSMLGSNASWRSSAAFLPLLVLYSMVQTVLIIGRMNAADRQFQKVWVGCLCGAINAVLALAILFGGMTLEPLLAGEIRKTVAIVAIVLPFVIPPLLSPKITALVISKPSGGSVAEVGCLRRFRMQVHTQLKIGFFMLAVLSGILMRAAFLPDQADVVVVYLTFPYLFAFGVLWLWRGKPLWFRVAILLTVFSVDFCAGAIARAITFAPDDLLSFRAALLLQSLRLGMSLFLLLPLHFVCRSAKWA